jgi:hypothetical protein
MKAVTESRDVALPFFNRGAKRGWVVNATPRLLYPREEPVIHCIGGWVGPIDGLDGCGKSRTYRESIPGPSRRNEVKPVFHYISMLL